MSFARAVNRNLSFSLVFMGVALFISCVSQPGVIAPRIVGTLPRDTTTFTQGLFYESGRLYESHGLYGQSGLRVLDSRDGSLVRQVTVAPHLFAEGCARSGDEIILLTWRERIAEVYSLSTLLRTRSIIYAGEGWGLTGDGKRLYMSNGSDTIFLRNHEFSLVGALPVRAGGAPVARLNELEWANGKLYANIWYSDRIAEINPGTGKVLRWIDCSGIVARERPQSPDHVLNGIAFDAATSTFYLTGKKWGNIYLVKF